MKTLFLVALFLTLPALVNAETISLKELVVRNDIYYKKFSDVPFTGTVNGQTQGTIKRGKRQGTWLWFDKNGQLSLKATFKDGRLHGLFESYFDSGQLEQKGNYKDEKGHGFWELYYESGQLFQKANNKDGKQDGLTETYRVNGQLWEKANYKDGKLISRTCFSYSGEQKSCD